MACFFCILASEPAKTDAPAEESKEPAKPEEKAS